MGFTVAEDTVLIADGGLATELEARGHDLSDALWSARLLIDAPQEIAAAHLSFFSRRCQIAATTSYRASFDGYAACGIGRKQAQRLLRRSVRKSLRLALIAAHPQTSWRPSMRPAALAVQWASAGARVIGGCCRVRPADIAELAAVLN